MFQYRTRIVEKEPTYEQLVECNRQYLLAVLGEHPERAHMVPAEMLREAVKRKPAPAPEPEPEPELVIALRPKIMREKAVEIAARHDITVSQLLGHNKSPRFTPARIDFVVACRAMKPQKSHPQIGIFMNGRHHSTIIHYERIARRQQEAA